MPYKDPEKRKQAVRESVRKLRQGLHNNDVNPIPEQSVNPVNPSELVNSVNPATGPDLRLFDELAGLKKRMKLAEQTIESLVEQVASLMSEPRGEPRSRSKGTLDDLPFSRAKQAAGKGY